MQRSYEHVLNFALDHPWNIERSMLGVIANIIAGRLAGHGANQDDVQQALVNRKNLPQPRAGSIAIIPVYGVLAPRMGMMSEMSGGTSYEKLTSQLRAQVAEKTVKTIILDIDSGGGSAAGNAEFAAEIMRARTKKPIIAQAQYTMGSAAYQIGAAATEIVAAPSARVGSIGTYVIHDDLTEALKQRGITRTFIAAGEGKVDGNEAEPLSDTARARLENLVKNFYNQFVSNVVKGRGQGMTTERVKNEWKAHVYGADEALSIGMIDRIATLDETIARVLSASDDDGDKNALRQYFDSPDATPQEPSATGQELQSSLALQRQLLELQLPVSTHRGHE